MTVSPLRIVVALLVASSVTLVSGIETIDCDSINVDIKYYMEGCYNSSHIIAREGNCTGGAQGRTKAEVETVLNCVDVGNSMISGASGDTEYCHECGGPSGTLVCSDSQDTTANCDNLTKDPPVCLFSVAATSEYYCADKNSWTNDINQCDGITENADTRADVVECSPDFPYCKSCNGIEVCAMDDVSCTEIGLSEDIGSGPSDGDETETDGDQSDNGRETAAPASAAGFVGSASLLITVVAWTTMLM